MELRLRQICLVASELAPVIEQLRHVFSIKVCFVDSAVGKYGLQNSLLTIGSQFLEVVAPREEGTAAGRYLDRRGGDGGYMVITQCRDRAKRDARIAELAVPVANELNYGNFHGLQLHPKSTGGAFFEIDWNEGGDDPTNDDSAPWHPAGPDWQDARQTDVVSAITAAELQSPDPNRLANRWAEIAGLDLKAGDFGPEMILENAVIRFVEACDGRGEGLSGIDLKCSNPARAKNQARESGCFVDGETISICGTRIKLV